MNWIKVEDQKPKTNELVWLSWKGREVVIGYNMYEDTVHIPDDPTEGYYSIEDEKSRWVTHWMPIERPKPPEIE